MIAKIAHPALSDKTPLDNELYAVSCGYYSDITEDVGCIRENGRSDFFLFYVMHGKSTFCMRGERHTAHEGDIVFYNFGDRQEYLHLAGYNTQIYWLHFNGTKAQRLLEEIGITESSVFHTKLNLGEYFENIIKELTYKNEQYYKAAVGNIYMILANISRKKEQTNEELDYVISQMNSMENNSIGLDEYARMCNLSKSQFIRSFKSYTGDTPIKFKNKIIIKNAEWYLQNTGYSISEIAAMLQFENIYYFSTMFKKETGLSPLKYREKATGYE